jgi:hypothetical protein
MPHQQSRRRHMRDRLLITVFWSTSALIVLAAVLFAFR